MTAPEYMKKLEKKKKIKMWAITGAHARDADMYNHSHNARCISKDFRIRMKADLRKSSHCPDYERKK